ncbi:MarR family winged helix-turn-helix transcriptional regulator [Deinococcus gobiensis]|uniref:Transcriptional regulator, MarR family n=1 Tax=Deinococcus gobiensis (strain DSM 21396 / JCM 16679 / CGMCC 1.7299 / I-0) TaxID=745776 RepID=H8GX64_DEIGI|nr:MarR family transcriptional regulator [Deinococcus gobiensis]AFD24604.1 transcriptional regulator, MarR family [Deinococcus gobiensis I-0]
MNSDRPPDPPTPASSPGPPDESAEAVARTVGRSLKRYQGYVNAYTQRLNEADHEDTQLSSRQIGVLFQLRAHGTQNVSALARSVGLTLSATSHLLERLVQHGLVVRSEDPDNRRQKRIALSDQGQGLLGRLERDALQAYTLLLLHAPADVLGELRCCLGRLDPYLPASPGEFAAQASRALCPHPPTPSPTPEDQP